MIVANWLNWVTEHQNWFFGAMGAALIFYLGRGCISIISEQRRHSAGVSIPNWLAYALLILSTIIPFIILIVVVILHAIGAIEYAGTWDILVDIETIVSIIFVATGFLLGLVLWGFMRMIMWVAIEWLPKLFSKSQPRQDIPQEKGKKTRFMQNLLTDMLRKGLLPDRRLEVAVREEIGKHKGRILESDLTGLTKLHAGEKKVIDLSGIQYCINLQKLNIYDNQISDISLLSNLTKLQELVLTDGGIRNLRPLSNLTELQILRLGSNFIVDVRPLIGLISLRELYLWNNQINNITPLKNLANLRRLGLGGNQIINIGSLKDLKNLQELVLTDNWITDIDFLSNLTNLRGLYLAKNHIRDISPLVSNSGLGKGAVVDLMDNPLDDEAYDIHIPALQERGVTVRFNPKS